MCEPATVPVAVSGGLALLDLSACAKMSELIISPSMVKKSPLEKIFFIVKNLKV
jgi:hypothetical protein